jgi:broad specificity phosphatase PhoE
MTEEAVVRSTGQGLVLVLVQAAETDFSRSGRLEGDVDVPLTPRGRMRSRRIMEEVLLPMGGVVAVYTARNQGSRETAEILAAANSNRIRVMDELKGVSFGLWEGQLVADVRQRHARIWDPMGMTPPEGEEMGRAFARTAVAVKAIRRRHRGGNVAVVAPEAVISLVYCHLKGRPAAEVFRIGREIGHFEIVKPW